MTFKVPPRLIREFKFPQIATRGPQTYFIGDQGGWTRQPERDPSYFPFSAARQTERKRSDPEKKTTRKREGLDAEEGNMGEGDARRDTELKR